MKRKNGKPERLIFIAFKQHGWCYKKSKDGYRLWFGDKQRQVAIQEYETLDALKKSLIKDRLKFGR